ncbi:14367_t:CDS:1, partial [Rhizophagus irregularis]
GKSYVGVICGKFLEEFSNTKGFIVVYPSGDRYRVEIPGELSKTRKL